jgi:starch-binding outer membrane protein, SusD/RagB family
MKYLLLLLTCITLLSCKKFLDANPDTAVAVPSSLSHLQALLDHSARMNLARTPSFSELSSDDFFLLDDTYNAFTKEQQSAYTWSRLPYNIINDWSIAYQPVYTSNYCLDQLEKIPVSIATLENWNNVKGSALFFRSYYFLGLTWSHAKAYVHDSADKHLGIVLRMGSDFNVPSKRATVRETYQRILADTKEAIACLPDYGLNTMRPSKAAAYGLLARTYLSMRQYDSAFRYAHLCLQLKNSLIDYNADADLNGNVNAAIPFKRFNKETVFYTEMNGIGSVNSFTRARIDTMLYASYDNNDLRKKAFFRASAPYFLFKGSYTGNTNNYFTGITTAEILLTRAECYARLGNIAEAMNDLNTLMRKRWDNSVVYPLITAVNDTDAVNKILAERRKELYMRGMRWMDIKRLNRENRNIVLTRKIGTQVFTLLPNAGYYALPLPSDIIQITGIEQNQ